ncbi:TraR/DksA family transcriptional regulator [Rhodopirellula sp. MGV]|uniref:TraR/DksA family transcriptional regulator n=1 Tax=Rhodopirellula sp. MGV TaxID=2023130 RepID=UPI000B962B9B|nr:TraR/DksA family transcriptional regulator [Rhodopirellula sp. MGV]OYP29984.1 molecular chaperone DnaK [Rhodopirellula sp. MGV]PNY33439.1 molecular chaperone DnaK [Rhodopirellula baltica]
MARKDSLEKLRKILQKRRDALVRSALGDLSLLQGKANKSADVLDAVADTVQSELNSQLLEVESRELAAIDQAIERLDRGEYGTCEECGKPIPLTRLRAVPHARECIGCHRLAEQRRSHPAAHMSRMIDSYQTDGA